MVLGKLPVPGRPTFFSVSSITSLSPFPPLWKATRYRLKYCLKGSLNPKTTKQPKIEQLGPGLYHVASTKLKYVGHTNSIFSISFLLFVNS